MFVLTTLHLCEGRIQLYFAMFNLSIRELLLLLIVAKLVVAPLEMPKQKNPQIEYDSFRGVYPELGKSSECAKTNANYSIVVRGAGYVLGTAIRSSH